MITHQFNEELQVLEVTYRGEIAPEEVIRFYEYIAEEPKLPRNLKVLTDARNATYNFNLKQAAQLITSLKRCFIKYNSLTFAIIHAKPKETAYAQIMATEKVHKNHFHQTFATREKALEWLSRYN